MRASLSDTEEAEPGWCSGSDGEADAEGDALFGSLDGDEDERERTDGALDPLTARWLNRQPEMEADALALVERVSWDEYEEPRDEQDDGQQEERQMPTPLRIQVGREGEGAGGILQWSLVSPCSEVAGSPSSAAQDSFFGGDDADDADVDSRSDDLENVSVCSNFAAHVSDDESDLEADTDATAHTQPEDEPPHYQEDADKRREQQLADEQEAYLTRVSSSSSASSVSFHPQPMNPFALARPPPPPSYTRPSDSDSDSDSDTPEPPHSAGVARVPSFTRWRRQKARTYSGVSSTGLPLGLDALKARARTLSQHQQLRLRPRPRQRSGDSIEDYEQVEDDGDFSSDDEGYSSTTHRRRMSELDPCGAHWRRGSRASLAASRLSVSVSMGPAIMGKRLQDARNKLSSGLHLLRSGSTSTVASEESYLGSPAADEIKSAPPGLHLETSAAWASRTTHNYASSCHDGESPHLSRQQQLRAGVVKAAGFLNAASAEAARKLKTRAGGLRGPQLQGKTAASETEEEEPETTAPSVSPVAAPAALAVTPAA